MGLFIYVMKLTRRGYILGEFISRVPLHEHCTAAFIHPAASGKNATQAFVLVGAGCLEGAQLMSVNHDRRRVLGVTITVLR